MQLAKRLGADGVHLGQTDGDPREARALLGPSAQIGVPATTAATWRWKRARRAPTMSRSAPSIRPPPSRRTPPRPVDPQLVGDAVRNPLRRDRRDHAGQCGPLVDAGRRFPRGVPGGVGQGRSGGGGSRRSSSEVLRPTAIWPDAVDFSSVQRVLDGVAVDVVVEIAPDVAARAPPGRRPVGPAEQRLVRIAAHIFAVPPWKRT